MNTRKRIEKIKHLLEDRTVVLEKQVAEISELIISDYLKSAENGIFDVKFNVAKYTEGYVFSYKLYEVSDVICTKLKLEFMGVDVKIDDVYLPSATNDGSYIEIRAKK